jgi:hypothetical protein
MDSEKIKNSLIDEFYDEAEEIMDEKLKTSEEYMEFRSKLSSTGEKMAVLDEDFFDFEIDTLSIIEQGESIRENQKDKKEFILFILSSFILLSLLAIAVMKIGSKILIISQIVMIILTPWVIIPILAIRRKRSEV